MSDRMCDHISSRRVSVQKPHSESCVTGSAAQLILRSILLHSVTDRVPGSGSCASKTYQAQVLFFLSSLQLLSPLPFTVEKSQLHLN